MLVKGISGQVSLVVSLARAAAHASVSISIAQPHVSTHERPHTERNRHVHAQSTYGILQSGLYAVTQGGDLATTLPYCPGSLLRSANSEKHQQNISQSAIVSQQSYLSNRISAIVSQQSYLSDGMGQSISRAGDLDSRSLVRRLRQSAINHHKTSQSLAVTVRTCVQGAPNIRFRNKWQRQVASGRLSQSASASLGISQRLGQSISASLSDLGSRSRRQAT